MSTPPHDQGVDSGDNEGMPDAKDHQEADVERHAPAGATVHNRLNDARYRMKLGDQLSALIVEVGIRPAHYRDIQANDRLLQMWRGMLHDMYSLIWHVIGATTVVTQLRRTIARYKSSRST